MPDTGNEAFDEVVSRLPGLLEELGQAPRMRRCERPDIPDSPGVYLFTHEGRPIYVGRSKRLRERLKQHMAAAGSHQSASFAFNFARREAGAAGIDLARTRDALCADPAFQEHFTAAKETVREMEVQFVQIDDLVTRAVFEIFAAGALGTVEFNSFGEH
jgi:hypothetical protein